MATHNLRTFHILIILFCFSERSWCQFDPHCDGKQVIVELFEWKWSDVALECERFLSRKGFCGVQVSPPNEHVIVTNEAQRPWWERYQPVSYKLTSRSGNETEFVDMVARCKRVGIRIYVDIVVNNMAGKGRSGIGTAGSTFDSDARNFPGVPYIRNNFTLRSRCPSEDGNVDDYSDPENVRNCNLDGLTDLDQSQEYVRHKIAEYLNRLVDIGVAGFGIKAAKYMWPHDLKEITGMTKDVAGGGRPFIYFEMEEQDGDSIKPSEYTSQGYVTEFRYCQNIAWGIDSFDQLSDVYDTAMVASDHALVFVDNHDNQRDTQEKIVTFKKARDYKMAVAFLLANDYGFTRIMSSYYFSDNNKGPPHNSDFSTKDVTINPDGSCGNGWVCEHRWTSIANMVSFRNSVFGTTKEFFYESNDEVAFARGNIGFFAMAKTGHMNTTCMTGLPPGTYCDIISECDVDITVDNDGSANIVIDDYHDPIVAFLVGGRINKNTSQTTTGLSNSSVSQLTSTYRAHNSTYFHPTTPFENTVNMTNSTQSSFNTSGTVNSTPNFTDTTIPFNNSIAYMNSTVDSPDTTTSFDNTVNSTVNFLHTTTAPNNASEVVNSTVNSMDTNIPPNSTSTTVVNLTFNFTDTTAPFNNTLYNANATGNILDTTAPPVTTNFTTSNMDTTVEANNTAYTMNFDMTAVSNNTHSTISFRDTTNPSVDIHNTISSPSPSVSVNSTLDNTVDSTVDSTVESTVDSLFTMNSTMDSTVSSTVNNTANNTVNSTMKNTVDNTVDSTVDSTVNSTVDTSSSSASVSTSSFLPLSTTPIASYIRRTVIFIYAKTVVGQDVFIRGGLDHNRHQGCTSFASTSQCAIPIVHHNRAGRQFYAKFNAWSLSDNYLDWYGMEPGQGTYNDQMPSGTPAAWTTNRHISGYEPLNRFGDHYWMVDVDMDCSRTDGGWFEFKAMLNNNWERNVHRAECVGSGRDEPPYVTGNHLGKCGYMNIYSINESPCTIENIPSS